MRKVVYTVPEKVYVSCPVAQTLQCIFLDLAALFLTQTRGGASDSTSSTQRRKPFDMQALVVVPLQLCV